MKKSLVHLSPYWSPTKYPLFDQTASQPHVLLVEDRERNLKPVLKHAVSPSKPSILAQRHTTWSLRLARLAAPHSNTAALAKLALLEPLPVTPAGAAPPRGPAEVTVARTVRAGDSRLKACGRGRRTGRLTESECEFGRLAAVNGNNTGSEWMSVRKNPKTCGRHRSHTLLDFPGKTSAKPHSRPGGAPLGRARHEGRPWPLMGVGGDGRRPRSTPRAPRCGFSPK